MSEKPKEGWIEWAGGECPVPPETHVKYQMRHETRQYAETLKGWHAGGLRWEDSGSEHDIIAYRIAEATP